MFLDPLDHHLISESPAPLYMGELPRTFDEVPARVVINLCGVWPGGDPFGRVVLGLPMLDVLDPSLLPERGLFERFVDSVHAHASSEPSYWHCHAGINRSGLAVATYLHRHRGMRISDAILLIRAQRSPMALCNGLFEGTLRSWYGEPEEHDFAPFSLDDYLRGRVGT